MDTDLFIVPWWNYYDLLYILCIVFEPRQTIVIITWIVMINKDISGQNENLPRKNGLQYNYDDICTFGSAYLSAWCIVTFFFLVYFFFSVSRLSICSQTTSIIWLFCDTHTHTYRVYTTLHTLTLVASHRFTWTWMMKV